MDGKLRGKRAVLNFIDRITIIVRTISMFLFYDPDFVNHLICLQNDELNEKMLRRSLDFIHFLLDQLISARDEHVCNYELSIWWTHSQIYAWHSMIQDVEQMDPRILDIPSSTMEKISIHRSNCCIIYTDSYCWACCDMDRSLRIGVWCIIAAIIDIVIVNWP